MMQSWSGLLLTTRALLNDQDDAVYHDAILLPYLNMALQELQEIFELNSIPATELTSDVITVVAGKTEIGFTTTPKLPTDLVEIQQIYESMTGQNNWTPVVRRDY